MDVGFAALGATRFAVNVAVLLNFAALIVNLTVAAVTFALTSAPGWRRFRWLSVAALSAALYSLNETLFSYPIAGGEVATWVARLSWLSAGLCTASWTLFGAEHDGDSLSGLERGVLGFLVGASLLSLAPGMMPTESDLYEIPSLGIVYRAVRTTPFLDLVTPLWCAALLVPTARFVRRFARGHREDGLYVVSLCLIFVASAEELLVYQGVLRWPYLLGVGLTMVSAVTAAAIVRQVREDARRVSEFNRDLETVAATRGAELSVARDALLIAEREAALGRLAAGVGHEINNPLQVLRIGTSLLERAPTGSAAESVMKDMHSGIDRIERVVRDLAVFGRRATETEHCDPVGVVESSVRLVGMQIPPDIHFEMVHGNPPRLRISGAQLSQVVVNLLVNAAHSYSSSPNSAQHLVRVNTFSSGDGGGGVSVEDWGAGISPGAMPRIFEPYFTTKELGVGTGIGLYITKTIVENVGGTITIDSTMGEGTVVKFTIPGAGVEVPVSRASRPTLARSALRVLVIDDDKLVADNITSILSEHRVDTIYESQAGLERLLDDPGYDVILCDVAMPRPSGPELYAQAVELHPQLRNRFVFVTGGVSNPKARKFLEEVGVSVLLKPFDLSAINQAISKVLESTVQR